MGLTEGTKKDSSVPFTSFVSIGYKEFFAYYIKHGVGWRIGRLRGDCTACGATGEGLDFSVPRKGVRFRGAALSDFPPAIGLCYHRIYNIPASHSSSELDPEVSPD
jgi:hypothetical protein